MTPELAQLASLYRRSRSREAKERFAEEFIRAIGPRLKAFVVSRVPRDSVDDVIQETFIGIVLGLDSVDLEQNLCAWCFAIARNKSADVYRRAAAGRIVAVEWDELERVVSRGAKTQAVRSRISERMEYVREVLSQLEPRCQELIIERYFYDIDWEDMGAERDLTGDGARKATGRCLAEAKKIVSREEPSHA